jgi:hypothetical protein
MDKQKLILPASILLASIFLGGFYFASQVIKQRSIERQQQIDLQVKQTQQDYVTQAGENRIFALNSCLSEAKSEYNANMKNVYPTATLIVAEFSNILKNEQDACIKQYK